MYISQLGQDKFIDEFFKKKENLTFLDVGAHDGVTISNTFFLEKNRNWNGICIEAQPIEFEKLKKNRNCVCVNVAVSNFEGETDFTYVEGYANMLSGISDEYNKTHIDRIKGEVNHYGGKINTIKVPVKKLQTILDEHNIVDIDFCSIDTEGSEFNIIQSIDFDKTNIKVFIIENNYKETNVQEFLEKKGYQLYRKLEWDDIFIKKIIMYQYGDRDAWPGDYLRYDYNLNENSIVIDLGCYIGSFTENIYNKFNCYVYSFEPIKRYYDICLDKFQHISNIKVYNTGLSNENKKVDFTIGGESSSMYSNVDKPEIGVSLIKIDDFLKQQNIQKVDLLKMNIEGGEYDLLEYIISNNIAHLFENIQVQFHTNIFDGWEEKYSLIINNLPKTHHLTYKYEFKFENWKLNK